MEWNGKGGQGREEEGESCGGDRAANLLHGVGGLRRKKDRGGCYDRVD